MLFYFLFIHLNDISDISASEAILTAPLSLQSSELSVGTLGCIPASHLARENNKLHAGEELQGMNCHGRLYSPSLRTA